MPFLLVSCRGLRWDRGWQGWVRCWRSDDGDGDNGSDDADSERCFTVKSHLKTTMIENQHAEKATNLSCWTPHKNKNPWNSASVFSRRLAPATRSSSGILSVPCEMNWVQSWPIEEFNAAMPNLIELTKLTTVTLPKLTYQHFNGASCRHTCQHTIYSTRPRTNHDFRIMDSHTPVEQCSLGSWNRWSMHLGLSQNSILTLYDEFIYDAPQIFSGDWS